MGQVHTNTYCGNNLNNPDLLNGTRILGTKYQCMRKGFFIGRNLPYDENFAGAYAPVDARRYYCGNAPDVPAGYFGDGSPSICLRKGIGIGKAQRAALGPPAFYYFIRYVLPYVLFVLLCSIIFFILYLRKPVFVNMIDDEGNVQIDWNRFIPYYLLFCIIIAIIIWYVWKRLVRRWI